MSASRAPQFPLLVSLARSAERLAATRHEAGNSAHLLCVLMDRDGVARELLTELGVTREGVLRVAENWAGGSDPPNASLEKVSELCRNPTELSIDGQVLLALSHAKQGAAHRALRLARVDSDELCRLLLNGNSRRRARVQVEAARTQKASRAVTVPLTPQRPSPSLLRANPRLPEQGVPNDLQPKARESSKLGKRSASKGSRFLLDPRRFKLLNALGRNLIRVAEANELHPVVGRDAEVERLLDVLAKHESNNPCLVGVPGVGKTSVAHALAQRILAHAGDSEMDDRILIEVPVAELLASKPNRGAPSQRLAQLESEIAASQGRVVVFFDDVHLLFLSDTSEDLRAEFRRALSRGLRCIGATTPECYEQLIAVDSHLQRCFTRIEVEEPDADAACEILELAARRLSSHHRVEYSEASLAHAIAWASRYVPAPALPEKAIAIIDLAGARCRRRGEACVEDEHIADVVSELTQVPRERLLQSDAERLLDLESAVAAKVVGHETSIAAICRIVRRNAAGFHGERPIGTFLLLGPTGVGKTETAKALAHVLFGSEQAMTRLDLSEYSEAHAVARLIGAPPGYVGHEAGGQLTEAVRRRPYQVLLLDEIEKAHPDVLAAFLPLFDEGRLTDGRGRTVDFTNTVIFLTSNLGAREATESRGRRLGFAQSMQPGRHASERVIGAARERLTPEFFNRIDEVLVFGALDRRDVESIAQRMLQSLADRVFEHRDIELVIESSVVDLLLQEGGFDATLGARPMRRAIARLVEAPLAETFLRGDFPRGARVRLRAESGRLTMALESVAAE